MKADKREIVTFIIAALATLVAVWFFLSKMQKEKETVRTDLYTLVAPASDAILSVNRPAAFTKYILSRNSEREGPGYLSFHHPKQPRSSVAASLFPSPGSRLLRTGGKQPRRSDREKYIAKVFRLIRPTKAEKERHHFYLLSGRRKPFFRLLPA